MTRIHCTSCQAESYNAGTTRLHCGQCYAHLQATLAEREAEVSQLNTVLREAGWGQGEIDSAAYTFDQLAQANSRLVKERDAAVQETGRLRERIQELEKGQGDKPPGDQ